MGDGVDDVALPARFLLGGLYLITVVALLAVRCLWWHHGASPSPEVKAATAR